MKYNNETLRIIKEQATAENHRLFDAISIINGLATDGAITHEDAERIIAAIRLNAEKAGAIATAAYHALSNAIMPPLPFAPAPKPLTAEEEALLDQAAIDYFPAH